jgi:hypothetical protein
VPGFVASRPHYRESQIYNGSLERNLRRIPAPSRPAAAACRVSRLIAGQAGDAYGHEPLLLSPDHWLALPDRRIISTVPAVSRGENDCDALNVLLWCVAIADDHLKLTGSSDVALTTILLFLERA